MAYIVADRVKETTTVIGTGPATLLGAASGYRSFASQLSIGDTCAYVIVNSNASEWETGIGTYSAVNTLTRTTIQASTNANAAVVFTAGVKDVFMGPTANTVLSNVTSTDGSVTVTKTGSVSDLSVAVSASTLSVLVAVRNTTGATLTKGTIVYINGSTGQLSTVAKAIANSDATSAQTLGMISANLNNNSNGYVTIIGLVDNIDTKGYAAGTQLYLSPTVAGEFTDEKPYAPNHLVYIGVVERGTVQGKIFVKVQNGYELDELHDVSAQSPSNGQTIVYNSTTELWEKNYPSLTNALSSVPVVSGAGNNLTFTAGSGVTSGAGGNVTITAGNGSGVGAGGNIILQPGAQGSSGGNGVTVWRNSSGVEKARCLESGQFISSTAGVGYGWAAAGATSINHGLRCSNPGQGFITIQGQGNYLFSVDSNNGQTSVATPASSANWRFQLVNSTNAETVNGAWALSCSTSDGVALVRNGASAVAGGGLAFPSSTTAFSANTNNLVLTGSAFQRINCTSAASLTGIAPPSGGTHVDGRMVRVYNVGTANLTLAHNSASSTAANRMFSSTGADIVLAPNDYAELIYDATSNGSGAAGWRVS